MHARKPKCPVHVTNRSRTKVRLMSGTILLQLRVAPPHLHLLHPKKRLRSTPPLLVCLPILLQPLPERSSVYLPLVNRQGGRFLERSPSEIVGSVLDSCAKRSRAECNGSGIVRERADGFYDTGSLMSRFAYQHSSLGFTGCSSSPLPPHFHTSGRQNWWINEVRQTYILNVDTTDVPAQTTKVKDVFLR